MKILNHAIRKYKPVTILRVFLLLVLSGYTLNSQAQQLPECDANVPFFIIDLSANPDSTYTTPEIIRTEQCCGGSSNQNFVSFYVTLHPDVAMIEIGIEPGYADPGGSGNYNIISGGDLTTPGTCGPDIPGGQTACITGSGPHKITYHKPGKNKVKYYLRQIPKPIYPQDDTTRVGCYLPLDIYGLDNISINSINSSTGNTTSGAYNSLLSCTDCANPDFSPGLATPAWIDYEICGTPQASACGVFQSCDTVRLYTQDALEVSVTPNPAEFCSGGSVTLTSLATGGDGNYSYNWYDSGGNLLSGTNTYTANTEATFTAEVLDGLVSQTCPAEFFSIPVTIGLPPIVDAGPDITVCASSPEVFLAGTVTNASDGIWSGGAGNYNPSSSSLLVSYTPTNAEISAGSVTMTLTSVGSGGSCPNTSDDMTIFFSDTVFINPTFTPIACNGGTTLINSNVSGGTMPYTYSWSNGSSAASTTVSAGTYSINVEDTYGCESSSTINVSEPTPIILTMSSTNTSTDIACDGSATVSITGGVGPYSVLWSNLETTLTTTNSLCYGIATVVVTDANGCVSNGSVVVNNPTCSAFSVTASNTDVSCYGDTDAQAFSFPSGGTAPYTYSWNTSPIQTTQNANNLGAGTYTITVTDNNGCIDVASVTVLQPSIITNTMTHTDATSIGGNEGTATANPAGGVPGYTYSWNPTSQSTQTAVNLSEGTYYVNILDANTCLKLDSVYINQPPCNDFIAVANPTDISCNGANDGAAYLVIAQGLPPYSISWSSGETNVMNVSGLSAGTYTVTVTDASNCSTFATFDITEPDLLTLGLVPTNSSCFGADDGTIDLTVSGGTFPYSYEWSTGSSTIADHEDLTNLAPMTYSIVVEDQNGCQAIGSVGTTEPNNLVATYTYEDVLCSGDGNGSIDVSVVGGTMPYNYNWTGPNGYTNSTQDISGLDIGLYQLDITDASGCTLSTSMQSYINEPDTVKIVEYTVPCPAPGSSNVIVSIDSLSGGAGHPYQVSFDGGSTYLAEGIYSTTLAVGSSYNVVARDSNGCNSAGTLVIVIDPIVEITDVTFNPCIAVGTTNVPITVIPVGGDGGPYEVSTDGGMSYNPAGTYTISVAVGNDYDIVIRDTTGCESVIFTITVPLPFDATAVLTSEASCPGAMDGSIDLTIVGGTLPYSIAWTGPASFSSTSEDISGLVAGTYNVVVTDDSLCTVNTSIIVTTTPDVTPPVITSCGAGNQSVLSDIGVCSYTLSGTAWDATATDDCFLASLEYTLSGATTGTGTTLNGVSFNLGTTTVLWTATDGSGNISTCTFDVLVTDNQLPAISSCGGVGTESVTVDPGVCSYTVSGTGWDAVATDNCTISTIEYTLTGATTGTGTSLNGVVFNLGTTTVLWTVTDGSGNISTCTFDVLVTDIELPSISTCGGNGTESVVVDLAACTFTVSGTGWDAQATDNCTISTIEYTLSGATTGTGTSLNGVAFNLGTTTVLWTVTDGSGNVSTCTFDVSVTDDQLPAISTCGGNGTESVSVDLAACTYTVSGTGWDAQATDNCTVSTIEYTLSGATTGTGTSLNGVAFNLGTTTVLWTVTDGSGNVSTCTFDVVVTDGELPAISSCGATGNQTVNSDLGLCTFTLTNTAWDAIATDNCTISTIEYTLSGATTGTGTSLNGVAFNLGTTTVLWTVTDGSGNISTCTFDVLVTDVELPSISTCGGTGTESVVVDLAACTFTVSGTGWDAQATDNCTVSTIEYTLTGATTGTGTSLNGVVFNLGTTTVLWTVTDGSGNVSTCTFDVSVTDDQLPAISTCGGNGTESVSVDLAACTYTVSGTGWDAQATDNCTISTIEYTLSGATTGTGTSLNGVAFNLGTTTVLWTVTDGSGNVSTCTFDVVVTDGELPAISSCGATGNQTVNSDLGLCTFTLTSTAWDAIATDNCTISTIEYTLSGATTGTGTSLNGVAFNLGTTTVLWTVTDGSGNVSTCTFDVLVVDVQLPAISTCGGVGTESVTVDPGVCSYTVSGTGWDAVATDNCTISTIEYTLTGATTGTGTSLNGVVFNLGTTTVLWTVTDGSGNISTCTFDVLVTDAELPSISTCGGTGTESVVVDLAACTFTVSGTGWDAQATDNCTISTIEYTLSGATTGTGTTLNGVAFNLGTTTVLWTVTDGSGNVSTCTFDVSVTDDQLPAISTCGGNGTESVSVNLAACTYTVSGTGWDAQATDNCTISTIEYTLSGATTGTGTSLNGVAFNLGTTTVLWTVTDGSGNVSTCTFDVVVTDGELPAISSCGATGTQTVNSDLGLCTFTLTSTAWDAIATDNCTISTIEYTLSGATTGTGTSLNGVAFNLGTTTVLWTVTDGSGNVSTCTFDVLVVDIQLPVISTCGGVGTESVTVDPGVCSYTVSGTGWDAQATDNCTVSTIEYTLTGATTGTGTTLDGIAFNLGTTTVLWTVTDGSGNISTCTFDVDVTDIELPVISSCGATGNQMVNTHPELCSYTHSGTAWNAIATDNCTVSSIEYTLSGATSGTGISLNGVLFNLGTTTVLWTVTDGSGNVSTCTFDVIVSDVQLPSILTCGGNGTQSVTVDPAACTYTVSGTGWDAQAIDNCTISSIVYTLSGATTGTGTSLNGVAFNLGTTTVLWTATDASGNVSTCTFDVIVTDGELPAISSCGATGTQTVNSDLGLCTYTLTSTAWDAIATDNCTISTIEYTLSGATTGTGTSLNGVVFNLGTTTVLWTVTDGSGNISTCTFDVIVVDIQLPIISTCGGNGTETVTVDPAACTYTVSGTGWDAQATDNCTISTIEYTLSGATTGTGTSLNGVAFNLGTTTVLWTVTDASGNISTCTFDVVVTDGELPAISSCGATGNQTVNTDPSICSYTHSGTSWDAIATDNCTVSSIEYTLSGATVGTGVSLNGVLFNLGTTTVLWTVTDGSGNVSTCTFDVTVTDIQLPSILTCGGNGTQSVSTDPLACTYTVTGTAWDAQAVDNCTMSSIIYTLSGATTGTGTSLNGVAFNLGTTVVLWTATDASGNISTCTFNVVVTDGEYPVISSCGAGGTQFVDTDLGVCSYTQTGTAWDAIVTDNCTVSSSIYTLSGATTGSGTSLDGVTFNQGTTTVLWTVTDGSGNQTTCTYDVIVSDNEDPIISNCVSDMTVNNDNGDCGGIVNWTPPTYTDNCGATMTSSHNPGDFFPIGTTTVTYTVTDNAGNISTCIFNITVTDNQLPAIACGADIESCDSLVTFNDATATDNCGIQSITQIAGLPSGSYFPVGTTTITYEAIDVNGNSNTCSFDVIIHPTPILSTVSTDVSCNSFNDGAIDLTVSNGTAPYTYAWSNAATTEDLSGLQPGIYGVTVTDANMCSAQITDTISEPDQLFITKDVTHVTCYGNNNGAIDITVVGGVLPYSFDWSNSATSEDVNNLMAGSYSVTVTDFNGCTESTSATITEPDSISIQSVVTNATCNAPNGSIQVQVTGGISPYGYAWSNGSTNANLTNVIGGLYTLTVTDANGCIQTMTDSVHTTSTLSADVYVTDVLCYGGDNGSALAIVDTGNPPFSYNWSNGDTTSLSEGLTAGSYSVQITDFFGCETTIEFDVFEPDSLWVDLYSPLLIEDYNVSQFGGADGSIQSDVEGGTPDYSYIWTSGNDPAYSNSNADIFGLESGIYTLTVTDANGCVAIAGIRLTQLGRLEMPEGVSPNGDGDNDYFHVRGLEAYPDNEIEIYNRWGNLVYERNGYGNDWQGENKKGEQLPDGTYFVILRAHAGDNSQVLTGYIDLRRSR